MSPLGSIVVPVNSDAVGKNDGGGIILEIAIGVTLSILDGLRQLLTTLVARLPPLVSGRAVFDHSVAIVVVGVRGRLPPSSSPSVISPLLPTLRRHPLSPTGDHVTNHQSLSCSCLLVSSLLRCVLGDGLMEIFKAIVVIIIGLCVVILRHITCASMASCRHCYAMMRWKEH